MSSEHLIFLLALLVPLTLDTFIVSTALGLAGLPKEHRLRTSLVFAGFEAVMPAVGVLLGRGLAGFAGHYASYIAGSVIGVAGLILLKPSKQSRQNNESKLVTQTKGLAIVNLGLGISIDEVALGLSLGLLHVPLLLAATLIGIQAFTASQLGLHIGGKLSERFRDNAEKIAGLVLILVAAVIFVLNISGHKLQ